ncbi:hypothetical protein N7493_004502 [Penicillium malachiteum]|uniref:NAD(P)-binding domain-containing protein n=1 Tax=Penicillium malachiteum TaxID=1324776 RepID=A0AAD6MXC6_9EURO|nr:hypothetical protein N7493_004502 [Penicillium malachiteum]
MDFNDGSSSGYSSSHDGNKDQAHIRTVMVTGAAGFIGGWFVRHILREYGDKYIIVGFDNLEYCASLANFTEVQHLSNFHFVKGDICDIKDVENNLRKYSVDAIVHFAAKTHVDESFRTPLSFTATNVLGTQILLEACRKQGNIERIVHVSTDEIYGENDPAQLVSFTEDHPMNPTNPYSASKAAAEMIVNGYQKSFKMPIIITRCNNVFGPYQFPEKLIPKFIMLFNNNLRMPIHGEGRNMRAFLYAGDAAEALDVIFHKGVPGEAYNIASSNQVQVLEVAKKIVQNSKHISRDLFNSIEMVKDRPFNDSMYWTDGSKLEALGWKQRTGFDEGLQRTIQWYSGIDRVWCQRDSPWRDY